MSLQKSGHAFCYANSNLVTAFLVSRAPDFLVRAPFFVKKIFLEIMVSIKAVTGNINDPHHFINLSQWKGQRFRYITDKACIVVNKDGELVTGWLKDEFGDILKQILKEAN